MYTKGQIIGQVFVYILAAVTFVLITLFGYNAIQGFVANSESVEFLSFKSELERSVKDVYTEYGAVRQENYNLPPSYREVCFVNLEASFAQGDINELCSHNALACSVASELLSNPSDAGYGKFDQNVFLSPTAPYALKIYRFTLCQGECEGVGDFLPYLCVPVSGGRVSLVLEGKGDHTEISLPNVGGGS